MHDTRQTRHGTITCTSTATVDRSSENIDMITAYRTYSSSLLSSPNLGPKRVERSTWYVVGATYQPNPEPTAHREPKSTYNTWVTPLVRVALWITGKGLKRLIINSGMLQYTNKYM